MPKNSKINVYVIGSGRAGMIHARNFAGRLPQVRLVAVVDPVEAVARKACAELDIETSYVDYKQALEDPSIDAVVVVTPTVYHREIVVASAKAGKHILCEKPMAMNISECVAMIWIF